MSITIEKKEQLEVLGIIPTKEQFALVMITKGGTLPVVAKKLNTRFSINKKIEIHVAEMQQEDGSAETWNWKGSAEGRRCHGFLRSGKSLIITIDEL